MKRATARIGCSLGMLSVLVVALAGCGFGPGEETGSASLLATSGYGREVLVEDDAARIDESSTALKLLDQASDLTTRYGGGFVQSVNGLAGTVRKGRSFDWFYSVNGIVAERGSAEFQLADGDRVWWDYRDWTDAMQVGAVVGAYPAPFSTGYNGTRWPSEVVCLDLKETCAKVTDRLRADGADLWPASDESSEAGKAAVDPIRVLVGPWDRVGEQPEGKRLAAGPAQSGIFARFDGSDLIGLDVAAKPRVNLGSKAGLVAAMRRGQAPPVWIVTGGSSEAVNRAAGILDRSDLDHRYAAIAVDDRVGSLPWQTDEG